VGVEKKGAGASACNAVPAKVGRRRNGWRLFVGVEERSSHQRIPSGGRHPGLRESVALRGAMSERGPWSNQEDGGNIQLAVRRFDDGTGCSSQLTRGGEPSSRASLQGHCGSRRHVGRVLRSALLGPFNLASSPNGHRRKRWSDRGVARKQRRDRVMVFGVMSCHVLAAWRGLASKGLKRLAAIANLLRQGKATRSLKRSAPKGAPKRRGGSERTFGVTAKKGRRNRRESGARECVRASEVQLQKSLGVCLIQRSAGRSFA